MADVLVYVDTSVFGGAFDKEFKKASGAFFDRVRDGTLEVAVSALVLNEIERGPIAIHTPPEVVFDEED